jgi:hypothetical protein
MRSELFGQNLETTSSEGLSLQNPRMLKARLQDSELLARQGAMVAYQGAVEFAYEGLGGVGRFLKKALTGEGVPLMRCRGTGDVFLAQDANELHILDLDGDSVTVNGANVLAFEPGPDLGHPPGGGRVGAVRRRLQHGLHRRRAAGHQRLRHSRGAEHRRGPDLRRPPGGGGLVRQSADPAGAHRGRQRPDRPRQRRGLPAGLRGQGFLVVQASEGPVVPTHNHGGGGGGGSVFG